LHHRSEFVQGKDPAVLADPLLLVKNRAGRRDLNQQREQNARRCKNEQGQDAADRIKTSHQELFQIPFLADKGAEKGNRIVAVDSPGQKLHINRRAKDDIYFQFMHEINQKVQVLFILDSLANNHFINIRMLQQQPNLVAADSLHDSFLSDNAVDVIPADDDDVLSDPLAGFEGELVQLENQEQIDEKGKHKNRRGKSTQSRSEDINKRDT
jgi:hypothetical protein